MNLLEETLMSKLVYWIMQQQQIEKKKTIEADISNLPSKSNLAILKAKINEIEVA